ncbi:MAG: glycosyltransferase, partial [Dehalococcoidia bacterium]
LCSIVHYRTRMNFTWQALRAAQRALVRLRQMVRQSEGVDEPYDGKEAEAWRRRFLDAVNDDLNIPLALATAWRLARSQAPSALVRDLLLEFDRILGFDLGRAPEQPRLPAAVRTLATEREAQRSDGDYAAADDIRRQIIRREYEVRDGRDGTLVVPRPAWAATGDTISASGDVPSLLEEPDALDFSVSVIARDNRPEVERALGSLLPHCGSHRVEVIVVDNGSSDGTADWLRGLAAKDQRSRALCADHNLGAAAARNVALKQARGRIVLLLDTSVEVVGDLFPNLSDRLADPEVGIVGRWGVCSHDLRDFVEVDRPGGVDAIEGYFMAFRRQLVSQVGLLDEKFRFYRHLDLDFSLAVRSLGYRLVIDHQLPVVRHEHGDWMRTPPEERERLSKRNFYRFLHKWGERHDLLIAGQGH